MKRTLRLAVITALTVSVTAATAMAADEAEKDNIYTGEILVTASRTKELIKTEPQAAEVITAEDIKRMGADDVLTALALAHNLDLSKAGMTGNAVRIRGMSTIPLSWWTGSGTPVKMRAIRRMFTRCGG